MPPSLRDLTALPTPNAEEDASSACLTALIREEIQRDGAIAFSRFMELALYAPGLGYYTAGREKFGARGDFTTAPESYPLFGRCLAHTAVEVLAPLGPSDILEVGAGSGALAATLLHELATLQALPRTYYILELGAELRARQATTIQQRAPAFFSRVAWLDRLPSPGFRGVVLANELLDAMPVERFQTTATDVQRLSVTWRENRFAWTEAPAHATICERVAALDLAPGYVSEIGFAAEAWVHTMAERLAAGVLLLIDYGFPRAEFYHPDRSTGTLMCHYRHRAHGDPLKLIGLQDITAHVDFTAIGAAGQEAGLDLLGYTSQAAFLIGSGLERMMATSDPDDVRAHLALTQQIKKLALPHEMGELYKVMALGRGVAGTPTAFALQDRRPRL